jgi:transposase
MHENEFLACDITSISSYSNLIGEVEYGYNRDHDKLKQINLCLLFEETSGLPTISIKYHGSLNDVKTLYHTVELFTALNPYKFKLVTDKGFYSESNINYFLQPKLKIPFIISVPAKLDYFKQIVENNQDNLMTLTIQFYLVKICCFTTL